VRNTRARRIPSAPFAAEGNVGVNCIVAVPAFSSLTHALFSAGETTVCSPRQNRDRIRYVNRRRRWGIVREDVDAATAC